MKELLILEMKRAIELLEKERPFAYWDNGQESAELKALLLAIRKHSILVEKDKKYKFRT